MRTLELLAPAKNLTLGMAAIDHGADAVYIGASRFGARASAGNSIEDIDSLCRYAHQFGAKVYVTVNTILFDDELDDTKALLSQLNDIGVDAILVQDMAVLNLLPESLSFALHSSTQTDNRTPEKIEWLHTLGFKRVVLARELSIDEIRTIHEHIPEVELEVFVHGALCVSYSGLCYASQYCFGRSANRGECAQFCRMKFDLVDADGKIIEQQRHLLSLKDMNQLSNLEQLAEAGACSFKIEGRLKDISYVKNVTAAYSQALDSIVSAHPDRYRRASHGICHYQFTPDLERTFHRGYTSYFAHGRQPDIVSFDTPKAIGQYIGQVKRIDSDKSFIIDSTATFTNGDGLCFFDANNELQGFRVNRVEVRSLFPHGNTSQAYTCLFPHAMPRSLRAGMKLYRNQDHYFEQQLSKTTSVRKIPITMTLGIIPTGFSLDINGKLMGDISIAHQKAKTRQYENIVKQLSKLGDTPYECIHIDIPIGFNYFIPSSFLANLRRKAIRNYERYVHEKDRDNATNNSLYTIHRTLEVPSYNADYFYNVSNRLAARFYANKGKLLSQQAFELNTPHHPLIMQCRHCLRYALGHCVKYGGSSSHWREPLHLQLSDGRRFSLQFDCQHCQMNVYAENH